MSSMMPNISAHVDAQPLNEKRLICVSPQLHL